MAEVFGIETDNDELNFQDEFECIYDNDMEAYYQSKKTFHHEEESFKFDYKYVVEILDLDALTGDEIGDYTISLLLVPTFESLCPKRQESVRECYDRGDYDIIDVVSDGQSILMCDNSVKHNGKAMDECTELQDKLNTIANVYEYIDFMRGFYLDKYQNRIGTTGWDKLDDFINGNDWVKATWARYDKEKENKC